MTTTNINKIAAEARTLLEGISKVNAKHDTLVADRNARVKPLLEKVHHTLTVLKQPVEGVTSWDGWAKKAGWSKRALNFILNGRPSQAKKNEPGTSVPARTFTAKVGDLIKWTDGRLWVISENKYGPTIRLADVQPEKKKKESKKTPRLTLRQTHQAINAIRKQFAQGNDKEAWQRSAENTQRYLNAILALNSAEKKPQYSAHRSAKKHAEERLQYFEREAQMKKVTHLVSDDEPGATWTCCARDGVPLTTDINAVECEECRKVYERRQMVENMRAVHAPGKEPGRTLCRRAGTNPKITTNKDEVDCELCQERLDAEERASWIPEFEQTLPERVTEKQKKQLWQVFSQAKQNYIYDPVNVTSNPESVEGEAMAQYCKLVTSMGNTKEAA